MKITEDGRLSLNGEVDSPSGSIEDGELRTGGVPLVMISSYRLYAEKFPHWVVVTGFDDHFLYVHDPYVDYADGKTPTDCMNLPILKAEFTGMARYGKSGQRAVIILRRRAPAASELALRT